MANLLESYKGRLALSEKYFAQKNNGAKLDNSKKMITAMCLDNVAKFMNESFNNSVGTQRSDLGKFKIFCMDITTLTMPNLIVNDLFIVQPMSASTGNLVYLQFGLGTEKGGVGGRNEDGSFKTYTQNEYPFTYGPMTDAREKYTSERVVEAVDASATKIEASWTPVVGGKVEAHKVADGTWVELDNGATVTQGTYDKIRYVYDNVVIPQEKLPTLVGRMANITLSARARRIAVYYSQLAAFTAKQDYGVDFESTIAQQAQAELQYEIDSEAVMLIKDTADAEVEAGRIDNITWVDEELDTISYSMKAEGFARKISQAKMSVYKRTNRLMPTWMVVSPDMVPILTFVPGFKAEGSAVANGPYVAGSVDGLKILVSPALGEKVCYLGVLGNDGKTGVGVYAPYMPLVPTQLLGFADGGMSQGFSTMYDMKILNPALLAKITVSTGNDIAKVQVVETSEI